MRNDLIQYCFRRDGMPDRRYLNLQFFAWLGRVHGESRYLRKKVKELVGAST